MSSDARHCVMPMRAGARGEGVQTGEHPIRKYWMWRIYSPNDDIVLRIQTYHALAIVYIPDTRLHLSLHRTDIDACSRKH